MPTDLISTQSFLQAMQEQWGKHPGFGMSGSPVAESFGGDGPNAPPGAMPYQNSMPWEQGIGAAPPNVDAGLQSAKQGVAGPDYDKIVNDYLSYLQKPVALPKPPKLEGWQAAAAGLNPELGNRIMQRENERYRLETGQFDIENRQRLQAAEIASRMAERQQQMRMEQAKDASAREWAMISAGIVPDGYQFKDPTAAQAWSAKQQEIARQRSQHTQEFNQIHPNKPLPAPNVERDKYLEGQEKRRVQLGGALDKIQQGWHMPGAEQYKDPSAAGREHEYQAEYEYLSNEKAVVSEMTPDEFSQYQTLTPQARAQHVQARIQLHQAEDQVLPKMSPAQQQRYQQFTFEQKQRFIQQYLGDANQQNYDTFRTTFGNP